MFQRFKATTVEVLNNPVKVRTILVLTTIALAAIAGGAPHGNGG